MFHGGPGGGQRDGCGGQRTFTEKRLADAHPPRACPPSVGLRRDDDICSSCERDKKKSRTDGEGAHNHALREHEAVAPRGSTPSTCPVKTGKKKARKQ